MSEVTASKQPAQRRWTPGATLWFMWMVGDRVAASYGGTWKLTTADVASGTSPSAKAPSPAGWGTATPNGSRQLEPSEIPRSPVFSSRLRVEAWTADAQKP